MGGRRGRKERQILLVNIILRSEKWEDIIQIIVEIKYIICKFPGSAETVFIQLTITLPNIVILNFMERLISL